MKKETSIAKLIERFTKAASMQRWNDHIRPVELTELDKQAHKMIIAYVLAKLEEDRGELINWRSLIEGGIFEFLQRVILTDIKAPVFHKMRENKDVKLKMDQHVLKELKEDIGGFNRDFRKRFRSYLLNPRPQIDINRRILRAAHYLATNWEFKIIYHAAPFIYGIGDTKRSIEDQIEDHYDLIGVQKILLNKKSFGFIDLCGQLRFQKRWAHAPRIPETSVLGHMLIVAISSYLSTMEIKVESSPKRFYNNYFGGLFHDLPEVLTRDIISPVKEGAELDDIIKQCEKRKMKEELLPLLPKPWRDEMRYFTEMEFKNKIAVDGEIKAVKEIDVDYDKDEFSPLDGKLIKVCDKFAAFLEASLSIKHGIKSEDLVEGKKNIYEQYKNKKVNGLEFGKIFESFN